MKKLLTIVILLYGTAVCAQLRMGWETGVNMTHHDFTQDLGNNYNQHIGIQGSTFINYKLKKYINFNFKFQLSSERISLGSRFANQQIYWRLVPTLEYEASDKVVVFLGANFGQKLAEYSFDFYGKNRRFDRFWYLQNNSNVSLQTGLKYKRKQVYIFGNINFEIISNLGSNIVQFTLNTDDLITNRGFLEVGLGYFLKYDLRKKGR